MRSGFCNLNGVSKLDTADFDFFDRLQVMDSRALQLIFGSTGTFFNIIIGFVYCWQVGLRFSLCGQICMGVS